MVLNLLLYCSWLQFDWPCLEQKEPRLQQFKLGEINLFLDADDAVQLLGPCNSGTMREKAMNGYSEKVAGISDVLFQYMYLHCRKMGPYLVHSIP